MKRNLYLLLLFCQTALYSQSSLVLNFDFESYNNCPSSYTNLGDANNCSSPTSSTPDYLNACAPQGNQVDVPSNIFGYQNAHSGSGYAGIWSKMDPMSSYLYREYLQMEMSTPMVVGTQYCVQFYASPADITGMACDGLGIWLRTTPYFNPIIEQIPVSPQFQAQVVIDDTSGWTAIGGQFTADSAYKYLVIGNFYSDGQGQINWVASPSSQSPEGHGAYYYIDDVIVSSECPDTIPALPIKIPNVFTPSKVDGINDTFVIENLPPQSHLIIYNRWGTKVYESTDYKNDWTGDNHSDGVYYYILNTPDGKDYHGTVTIL